MPETRARYILEDSGAGLILTNAENLRLAKELAHDQLQVMQIGEIDSSISAENPGVSVSPDAAAWILYTSGSTGQPKGVVQTHRNILHFVMIYTNGYHIRLDDRFALLYSFITNAGAHEIFSGLLNGASLHPFDFKKEGLTRLTDWMVEEAVTIYSSVPTLYRRLATSLSGNETFPHLRLLKMVGEPVYRRDVDLFREKFSRDCIFINRLGSTETGTIRWYFVDHETSFEGTHVPVGHAIPDNEVLVLGKDLKPAPVNEVGEIAVKSRFLSPGYWRKPELTEAAFFPDPSGGDERIYRTGDLGRMLPDGRLVHVGRKDHQVKIKGYRIEVAEIETALLDLSSVKETVVLPKKDKVENLQLVAYYVPSSEGAPTVSSLRRALGKKLPNYMIPSVFIKMDGFPLAPNGKINRGALPEPASQRPALETTFVRPRNSIEKKVAEIWSKVLGLDELGVDDPFLELGGDSIRATQVISRVLDQFQVKVPMQALMHAPTIASMAELIMHRIVSKGGYDKEKREKGSAINHTKEGTACELSFAQERIWILNHLENVGSTYNNPLALRIKGILNKDALKQALQTLVTRHESLRTTIHMEDESPVQVINSIDSIEIKEFDLCGEQEGSIF